MSTTVELTQKPDSPYPPPAVGQERWFETKPNGNFTKAKNAKEGFDGAVLYTVEAVEDKEDWVSEKHGTFNQWSLQVSPKDGAAGAVGGAAPAAASDQRGEKIDRAVAFKAAVSFLCRRNLDKPADPTEISTLTDSLLAVLTGAADPKEPVSKTTEVPAKPNSDEPPF